MGTVRTIYLTGFSGTGKSTVARHLAAQLGVATYDVDAAIVERAGRPIADIFASDGEPVFRALESEALRSISVEARERGGVIATGGGVPLAEANRRLMFEHGWVIGLEARPETIYERVHRQLRTDGQAGVRPLLDDPDALGRIQSLKTSRQFVYSLVHWTIHTDRLTPQQVASEIIRAIALLERGASPDPPPDAGFQFGPKWFGRDRPLVCVPIVAATREAVLDAAERIVPLAPDAVELRADYLDDVSPTAIEALLPRLAERELPILFTNRVTTEGGAREQDEAARVAALLAAIETGIPALVDVELGAAPTLRDRVIAAGKRRGIPVILSFHHFAMTPTDDELMATVRAMAAAGADAAKLAVMPQQAADATRLLALTRRITSGATGITIPLAAMAMGPLGMITRVVGHQSGSALTFAAVAAGAGSAPGQLTVEELRTIWAATTI
ncbi:MAG TPA: type I 3-dehydroquinate dehydratase [Thermomicrobiales bacterium]|jgi:3-dehydroquinate dehydratase-1